MDKFLCLTMIFFVQLLQAQSLTDSSVGIKWTTGLSWRQILEKTRAENKYLLVDCYATWCGPCKAMDKNVYPDARIGNAVNEKFIAIKVQMDRTLNDNENVRNWYSDARKIGIDFNIKAYPTLLFFSPDGSLIHKVSQGYNVDGFLDLLSSALNPKKQYYTQLREYQKGKRDKEMMRELAIAAIKIEDKNTAYRIAEDYISTLSPIDLYQSKIKEFIFIFFESVKAKELAARYIDMLKESEFYNYENIRFVRQFTTSAKDRGFKLFYEHPSKINKIMDVVTLPPGTSSFIRKGDYAQSLVRNILYTEIIYLPIFERKFNSNDMSTPDWALLKTEIKKTYPLVDAESLITEAKIIWYQWDKNWKFYSISLIERMNRVYSGSNLEGCSFMINNDCWSLFEHAEDTAILDKAIYWMEQMFSQNEKDREWPVAIDTYANLLYKSGRKTEALIFEEKAVKLKPLEKDFQKALEKMKLGEPTWQQERQNFSGLWRINIGRSDYSKVPVNTLIKEMNILQEYNQISIERKAGDVGQEMTSKENLTFDGKITEQQLGDLVKKSSVTWNDNGRQLIERAIYDSKEDRMDRNIVETWSISSDGKNLTVIRNVEFNSGFKYSTKCFYEKE